jgi:hypothetical protein
MAISVFTVFYLDLKIWVFLSSKPLLDMAHAHDRLTKHFGKDGKEPKKITNLPWKKLLISLV